MDSTRPGISGPEPAAKQTVQRLRERVVEADPDDPDESLTRQDRNAIIQFDENFSSDRQKNGRAGWLHHRNKLRDIVVFAEETQCLAATLEDGHRGERAVDKIVDWITEQNASGYTIQGNLSTLRVFAQTVLRELPKRFEEIEPSAHVDEDPAPLPSNIIEYEDLLAMIEETDSTRDCAMMAVEWDGGFRPLGELYQLQYKHVKIRDGYALITLEKEGKTDRHEVAITVGVSYLDKWIHEDHPVHDDPEAELNSETFIWTRQDRNALLCYGALAERFDVAAEAAGIQKDHCPQHFRRSCASILARQPGTGLTDLMERFSWARASNAPWHYIGAHSNPTNAKVLNVRGHEIDDLHDEPETAPILCPDCGEYTMRGLSECVRCGVALDPEQPTWERRTCEDPRKAGERSLGEMVLAGDVTAEDLRTIRRLETPIRTKRDLFEDLDELIVKAEALEDGIEQHGGSVSSLLGVGGILGQLSSAVTVLGRRWLKRTHAALTVHPDYEKYPARGPRLVGLVASWLVLLATALAMLATTGLLATISSDVTMATVAIASLGVGLGLVGRALPSLEDALLEAASN